MRALLVTVTARVLPGQGCVLYYCKVSGGNIFPHVAFLRLQCGTYQINWCLLEFVTSVSNIGQLRQPFLDYCFRKRSEKNSRSHDYMQHFVKLLLNHIPQLWGHLCIPSRALYSLTSGFFLWISAQPGEGGGKHPCHIKLVFSFV